LTHSKIDVSAEVISVSGCILSMQRWQAAIATENPKLMYLLVELLKTLDLTFVMCTPEDRRSCSAKVVLTTLSEAERVGVGQSLLVDEDFDSDLLKIKILAKLNDIETPRYVFIGVDPGMMSGVALVAEGITLYQSSYNSPRATARAVLLLHSHALITFPECIPIARVGAGSRLYSALMLREISGISDALKVEVVNEERTTLFGGSGSNESSAILIAGRRGRPVLEEDLSLEPKPGYIKSLKALVRRLNRSKQSISTELARQVVVGERSLASLLDELISP
jgi:hypothetical protein